MDETIKNYTTSVKLRCINIVSAKPKRLADFYKFILGANIDESRGGPHRIEIWFGDKYKDSFDDKTAFIVVNYDEGFTAPTYDACRGFEIQVSDANAEYKRIKALGVEVKVPPKDLPWGYRFFNIKDPDGNGIDIVQALLVGAVICSQNEQSRSTACNGLPTRYALRQPLTLNVMLAKNQWLMIGEAQWSPAGW